MREWKSPGIEMFLRIFFQGGLCRLNGRLCSLCQRPAVCLAGGGKGLSQPLLLGQVQNFPEEGHLSVICVDTTVKKCVFMQRKPFMINMIKHVNILNAVQFLS